jgi:hypothetical protein
MRWKKPFAIDHCLEDTVSALNKGERAPLEAFKQITKYL